MVSPPLESGVSGDAPLPKNEDFKANDGREALLQACPEPKVKKKDDGDEAKPELRAIVVHESHTKKLQVVKRNLTEAERSERERRREEASEEEYRRAASRNEVFVVGEPEMGLCEGFINIITQFPVLPETPRDFDPDMTENEKRELAKDINYAQNQPTHHRERRQLEYFETLKKNINNPQVKNIHLLLERETDFDWIISHGVHDPCNKLVPILLGRWMHYRDAVVYAERNLSGQVCAIMNSDIFLASGFNILLRKHFEANGRRKVYVLSRWEGPSVFCVDKPAESCLKRSAVGSYDAFVFVAPLPINLAGDDLDFKQNIWGAENAFISLLEKSGRVDLRNPCQILQIGHNHCDTFYRPNQGTFQGKYRVVAGNIIRASPEL